MLRIVPHLLQKYDLESSLKPANPYHRPQTAITIPVKPTAPIHVFAIPYIRNEIPSSPARTMTDNTPRTAEAIWFAEYFFSSKEYTCLFAIYFSNL